MDRTCHYEAAFEALLRQRRVPYVPVDEAKKALFGQAKLKSFDFMVYSQKGPNLLVDIKGRQACQGNGGFQTWASQQDVDDLMQWQQVFGPGYLAVLMFVYWIDPPLVPDPSVFEHNGRSYLLLGVDLESYRAHMRRRSTRWQTVCLPAQDFRELARPLDQWV